MRSYTSLFEVLSGFRASQWEIKSKVISKVSLSKGITAIDKELSSKDLEVFTILIRR